MAVFDHVPLPPLKIRSPRYMRLDFAHSNGRKRATAVQDCAKRIVSVTTLYQTSHPENRPDCGAWVTARPAAGFDLMEEIITEAVEQVGLFEIQRMPGVGQHNERGALDAALHQQGR